MATPSTTEHDLEDLLAAAGIHWSSPTPVSIRRVEPDSRRIEPGDLFVAIDGLTVDGHRFAARAVQAGASAVLCQQPLTLKRDGRSVPCVQVEDSARALGSISSKLAGNPSRRLALCGITGTNGKSTTAFILREMLQAAGLRCGLLAPSSTTTGRHAWHLPSPPRPRPSFERWLARMVDAGCSHAVLEVSSHGLALGRTWGCRFEVAAFSNLTQDHLDLHGAMEQYLEAKLLLFERHLAADGTAVVNADAACAERVIAAVRARGQRLLLCSSEQRPADLRLVEARHDLQGIRATLQIGDERREISSPLVGAFNGENLLLAAGCAHALGASIDAISEGMRRMRGVPGRLEQIPTRLPAREVFVDYAHTPDALGRALDVLRPLCQGRLIALFGCGGDRDRSKRPLMGSAAARRANIVVLTSDNPRSEDPLQVIAEIEPGVSAQLPPIAPGASREAVSRGYWVEPDRATAITTTVGAMQEEDVLLIAGKGHETYQLLGDRPVAFDDREQARAALRRREASDA